MLYQHVSVFCFLMSQVEGPGMFKHVRALSRAAFLRLFTCNEPIVLLVFSRKAGIAMLPANGKIHVVC